MRARIFVHIEIARLSNANKRHLLEVIETYQCWRVCTRGQFAFICLLRAP